MIQEALSLVTTGKDLPEQVAAGAMEAIITGSATSAQIGSFLTALRMKGETPTEVAAFAGVMRAHAVPAPIRGGSGRLVDTCGTGGDLAGTFNISTAAAIVAAGAGVRIVKHGNRSASGRCGSADVLEELGVNLYPTQEGAAVLEEAGIVFLFAQAHHPAMRHVAAARKEIGFRTVFNILGPLTNPAGADAQLLGVSDPGLLELIPPVLQTLGVRYAMVVHGGGLDEISTAATTRVVEVKGTELLRYTLTPEQFGLPPVDLAGLQGRDVTTSAAIIRGVLNGEEGPCRDVTLLNAAAAIYLGGRAIDLRDGLRLAAAAIDSGAAADALMKLVSAGRGER